MLTKTSRVSSDAKAYDQDFHAAFLAVKKARSEHVRVRPHRAITALKVTPYLLAQAVLLPVLLCALLVALKPTLLEFWRDCIVFWSEGLGLPFGNASQLSSAGSMEVLLSTALTSTPMPGSTTLWVTALVSLLGVAVSYVMTGARVPLKYPLRIVCVVQLVAVAYFWWWPTSFPYTIVRHSEELMTIGYVVMLATPVMLAVGYYLLNQSLGIKLFYTALILLFFTVMIPHQVLAHAVILQHMSVLFMPVLYICFGAVFDALVFVALYSWAASNAKPDATI